MLLPVPFVKWWSCVFHLDQGVSVAVGDGRVRRGRPHGGPFAVHRHYKLMYNFCVIALYLHYKYWRSIKGDFRRWNSLLSLC